MFPDKTINFTYLFPLVNRFKYCVLRSLTLSFYVSNTDGHLYFKTANGPTRLVVMDETQKERVLRDCHDNPATGGHQGRTRTFNKIARAYYWQGIFTDVTKWVRYLKTQTPGPQDGFIHHHTQDGFKCK